ncbi:hypothetical protein PHLGIDRAFT_324488 [Phlebiopsis gigantea 11061_1 CR5-6]|uniref:Uncharacterized protein n=1 Tax=Phlebiopsis gigantea (strain 11061_1 CR5-6) TaxID=745531 RepID=A0A0C3NVQ0_PHLG1|nr:hypothetical protein PHLGIDRAFT_324488 [Phlebiopsis gigantea 11061_1 CR5-6]
MKVSPSPPQHPRRVALLSLAHCRPMPLERSMANASDGSIVWAASDSKTGSVDCHGSSHGQTSDRSLCTPPRSAPASEHWKGLPPCGVHPTLLCASLPASLVAPGGLAQSRPELGSSLGPGRTRFVFCPQTVSVAANGVFLPHRCPLEPLGQ